MDRSKDLRPSSLPSDLHLNHVDIIPGFHLIMLGKFKIQSIPLIKLCFNCNVTGNKPVFTSAYNRLQVLNTFTVNFLQPGYQSFERPNESLMLGFEIFIRTLSNPVNCHCIHTVTCIEDSLSGRENHSVMYMSLKTSSRSP